MDAPRSHRQSDDHALPDGWRLVARFDGDNAVWLEFQWDGEFGPRVTGFGTSFDEALQSGEEWMERYDERERNRQR